MLDLMARIFKTALPEFRSLKDFEWIGYPEMRAEMVKAVLESHPNLHGLGLVGWHFDAEGVSAFRNLRKFTLRAEDDDGFADMGEVRTVLDKNEGTLRHLILGAYLERHHSWDSTFQTSTVKSLTLHGTFEDVPSLDLLGWHGEPFVVLKSTGAAWAQRARLLELEQKVVEVKDLPSRRRLDCGNGVDLGGEDAAWLERKDVPMDYEVPALM